MGHCTATPGKPISDVALQKNAGEGELLIAIKVARTDMLIRVHKIDMSYGQQFWSKGKSDVRPLLQGIREPVCKLSRLPWVLVLRVVANAASYC